MSEKPHKPIKSEHKGETRTPEPSAKFSAGVFREWLKTQKFSEEFMMREACDLAMADDTMKTLEDLPAGVMERLWKSRERIKTEWMLKYGEIVSVTPLEKCVRHLSAYRVVNSVTQSPQRRLPGENRASKRGAALGQRPLHPKQARTFKRPKSGKYKGDG